MVYYEIINILSGDAAMTVKLKIQEIEAMENITSKMDCPLDFKCYKSGFEDLCGSIVDSGDMVLECVDENTKNCRQSFPFGLAFLCTCPMRLYIARHFHK